MKGQMFIQFVILYPNFLKTFQDYGRGGTTSPDGTSLPGYDSDIGTVGRSV